MSNYYLDVTFKPKRPDDDLVVERIICMNKSELEARYKLFDARGNSDVLFLRPGHSDDVAEKAT